MSFSRWTAAVRTDGRTRENVIEPALQVWDENISFLLIKFTRSPPPPTPRKIRSVCPQIIMIIRLSYGSQNWHVVLNSKYDIDQLHRCNVMEMKEKLIERWSLSPPDICGCQSINR